MSRTENEILEKAELPVEVVAAISDLRDFLESQTDCDSRIASLAGDLNLTGGKMLRPMLLFLFAQLTGSDITLDHIKRAAAVELLHNASLLHDDVIDTTSTRRGRETFNNLHSNKTAILFGDLLMTRAMGLFSGEPFDIILKTISAMTTAELIQSQNNFNFDITFQTYLEIIEKKTALLFANASLLGLKYPALENEIATAVFEFGKNFGIAYQLKNDYRNIFSGEIENRFSDIAAGTFTLPIIHCLESDSRELLIDAIKEKDNDKILSILQLTASENFTLSKIEEHKSLAIGSLSIFTSSAEKDALVRIVEKIL